MISCSPNHSEAVSDVSTFDIPRSTCARAQTNTGRRFRVFRSVVTRTLGCYSRATAARLYTVYCSMLPQGQRTVPRSIMQSVAAMSTTQCMNEPLSRAWSSSTSWALGSEDLQAGPLLVPVCARKQGSLKGIHHLIAARRTDDVSNGSNRASSRSVLQQSHGPRHCCYLSQRRWMRVLAPKPAYTARSACRR